MKEPELILIIDTQNFNEILDGSKKEDYRELSDFYAKKLMVKKDGEYVGFKPIDKVCFALGYVSTRKLMTVEVKSINIDRFLNFIPEGFQRGDEVFTIELGKIIDKNF
jgi:hypothetical protein